MAPDTSIPAEPPVPVAQVATAAPSRGIGVFATMFESLRYRDFQYLWLGQITHAGALWLDMVARPLLVLALTGSPVHLGLVMAARTLPAVVLGLFAGVVADNFNRRLVLLATKVVVLGLGTLFALLVVTDSVLLWHIYLFSLLRGATMAFDQPARRAMVPSVVPRRLVTNAMALSSGSVQVMRIVGAGGAGLIIAFVGLKAVFVAIVVFYALAVVFTWLLRVADHKRRGYDGVGRMFGDLVQGLKFAWADGAIRGILIVAVGYFLFGMSFMSVFAPLFATKVLGIGESGFGYLMSAAGLGGVVGSLVLAAQRPRRRGMLLLGMLTVLGGLLIAFSGLSYLESAVPVFILAGLIGAASSAFFPVINAVLVESASEEMRGRTLGLLSLDRGFMTAGGAVAGLLAAGIGTQSAQFVFGAGCLATAVCMFVLFPAIRRID